MKFQVNEIFESIQGEGLLCGQPATFIRLQGCSVGCPWCDTKYAIASGGFQMTVEEIVAKCYLPWVIITGGEPMEQNVSALIRALRPRRIQLETNGNGSPLSAIPDYLTWSPKEQLSFTANLEVLANVDEVKLVIDDRITEQDIEAVMELVLCNKDNVVYRFMPEGSPPSEKSNKRAVDLAIKFARQNRLDVRFGPRLQYYIGVK